MTDMLDVTCESLILVAFKLYYVPVLYDGGKLDIDEEDIMNIDTVNEKPEVLHFIISHYLV